MIQRKKYKESFIEIYPTIVEQYICIYGQTWIWKKTFLRDLEDEFFTKKDTEWLVVEDWQQLSLLSIANHEAQNIVILSQESIDFSEIRTFIESQLFFWKVIFCSSKREESGIYNFYLPWVGFREYSEYRWYTINIWDIASGNADIQKINKLKEEYLFLWHFPSHIEYNESIYSDFQNTCELMNTELFPKEYQTFLEYMRSIAMNIGNLFKADQLAKLLGISRRKVNKYTEILMRHWVIYAIGPWWENTETETSRHVKLYFWDLSFMRCLLGDMYFQWQMKQWVLENFIFLELYRKLDSSHKISFYRKKSGAEITFILENLTNNKLTPIELSIKNTLAISQAMKTFDDSYNDRVEYYMLVNESTYTKKELNGKPFIILPQVGI